MVISPSLAEETLVAEFKFSQIKKKKKKPSRWFLIHAVN